MPQGAIRAGVDAGERGGTIKKAACEASPMPQDVGRSTPPFASRRGPQAAYIRQPAPGPPTSS